MGWKPIIPQPNASHWELKKEYHYLRAESPIYKKHIEDQKEHHQKQSFRNEYLKFLQEYAVVFDENYLWK